MLPAAAWGHKQAQLIFCQGATVRETKLIKFKHTSPKIGSQTSKIWKSYYLWIIESTFNM